MRMIFHYPGPFQEVRDTGEKKRPPRMCEAFEALGLDVIRFVGTWPARRRLWCSLRDTLADCRFVYSESSTLPPALTEPDHIPRWPAIDSRLLRACHRTGVPVGVFYRDAHWRRGDFRRQVGAVRYRLALPFYHAELRLYRAAATRIFVPSLAFGRTLPHVCRLSGCLARAAARV
jgi:hypothetical protein